MTGAPRRGGAAKVAAATGATVVATAAGVALDLDTEALTAELVAAATVLGILSVAGVVELDEGEGGGALEAADLDVTDAAVLVEEVVELRGGRRIRDGWCG